MGMSFADIVELSVLFWIAFVPMALLAYLIRIICALVRRGRIPVVFSCYDLFAPFASVAVWCGVQSYSLHVKSLSNISEIGFLGMIWGGGFVLRIYYDFKGKKIFVSHLFIYELVIAVISALFMPGFSE